MPFAAPGDRIVARITESKKRFLVGEIQRVLRPSPHRRTALCSVFGRCGGCRWQHIEYSEQLKQKQGILDSALRSLRKSQSVEIPPMIASPDEFGYRNRIQVQKAGDEIGFFARASNEIVTVKTCPIAEPEISQTIVLLTCEPDGRYEISRRADGSVGADRGRRDVETALFSQVNSKQNAHLIQTVLNLAGESEFSQIWDLYCGSGNLTFPLAKEFSSCVVYGVELSREAIAIAQKSPSKINWRISDVSQFLRENRDSKGVLVVVDPPRTGLHRDVARRICQLRPSAILYVSCDPMTFSRDAQIFIASQYRLRRVVGLDMFPQTEHIELIGQFSRA